MQVPAQGLGHHLGLGLLASCQQPLPQGLGGSMLQLHSMLQLQLQGLSDVLVTQGGQIPSEPGTSRCILRL